MGRVESKVGAVQGSKPPAAASTGATQFLDVDDALGKEEEDNIYLCVRCWALLSRCRPRRSRFPHLAVLQVRRDGLQGSPCCRKQGPFRLGRAQNGSCTGTRGGIHGVDTTAKASTSRRWCPITSQAHTKRVRFFVVSCVCACVCVCVCVCVCAWGVSWRFGSVLHCMDRLAEKAKQRKAKALERKLARWKKAGYSSRGLPLPESDSDDDETRPSRPFLARSPSKPSSSRRIVCVLGTVAVHVDGRRPTHRCRMLVSIVVAATVTAMRRGLLYAVTLNRPSSCIV